MIAAACDSPPRRFSLGCLQRTLNRARLWAAVALAALLSWHAQAAMAGFSHVVVDPGTRAGEISMVMDASGNPHVTYYDYINRHLQYAWRSGSDWHLGTPWGADNIGSISSIALDADGYPHMIFTESTGPQTGRLWYCHKSASGWSYQLVDTTGAPGLDGLSMVLDPAGNAHVAYSPGYGHGPGLMYAKRVGTSWTLDSTAAPGENGAYPSICVDVYGRPHISFYATSMGYGVGYAWKAADGWHREMAIPDGYPSSLVLDAEGHAHIAAWALDSPSYHHLRYATNATGAWAVESFPDSTNRMWRASLAVSQEGRPRIAYACSDPVEPTQYHLMFAGKQASGEWAFAMVDDSTNHGRSPSMALDQLGNPGIAYVAEGPGGNAMLDYAEAPLITPVEVGAISAEAAPEGVSLRWRAYDSGVQAFRVDRAPAAGGAFQPVSSEIPPWPSQTSYSWRDVGAAPGSAYRYRIGYRQGGQWSYTGILRVEVPAAWLAIRSIGPNPSAGPVRISCTVDVAAPARIEILGTAGQRIRTMELDGTAAGLRGITWDLRGADGREAASGVYYVRLISGTRTISRPLVVLK